MWVPRPSALCLPRSPGYLFCPGIHWALLKLCTTELTLWLWGPSPWKQINFWSIWRHERVREGSPSGMRLWRGGQGCWWFWTGDGRTQLIIPNAAWHSCPSGWRLEGCYFTDCLCWVCLFFSLKGASGMEAQVREVSDQTEGMCRSMSARRQGYPCFNSLQVSHRQIPPTGKRL